MYRYFFDSIKNREVKKSEGITPDLALDRESTPMCPFTVPLPVPGLRTLALQGHFGDTDIRVHRLSTTFPTSKGYEANEL